ncbi:RNA polymerase sigma-70 factor, ECF subfamily [Agreia bicolorata]|uniref:RNA polymerase sigma-70 factor, ECF subfamily n=1 Tax=Agreia bicolorata TaxID=110935 RepID=A0A1T4XV37_9MICO|nr:sigma-70 family RNA polymerase sigma factor [Agreia bicolorata]SKA93263.1 RNA polymerase sigma-70 factor, ECF subfamily [Agreia bicolorata]
MLATIPAHRIQTSDDKAFAQLVQRHSAMLRLVAHRTLGGNADVDDVVQEAFLAAWTHAESVVEGETIAGWLVTTVRRRSYDRLRSSTSRRRADLDDEMLSFDHDDPAIMAHCQSLASEARRVLESMPYLQRRCWELRQLDHLSYTAIASELMIPPSTVRGLLVRARARLARDLADWR